MKPLLSLRSCLPASHNPDVLFDLETNFYAEINLDTRGFVASGSEMEISGAFVAQMLPECLKAFIGANC